MLYLKNIGVFFEELDKKDTTVVMFSEEQQAREEEERWGEMKKMVLSLLKLVRSLFTYLFDLNQKNLDLGSLGLGFVSSWWDTMGFKAVGKQQSESSCLPKYKTFLGLGTFRQV